MKAVIIDDESINLNLFKAYGQALDLDIVTFEDSVEALDYLLSNDVDIVYVDYMMPNLDGIELIKQFREVHKTTPVIMITAVGNDNKLKLSALEAGVTEFLTKPVDNIEFKLRTKTLLELRKAQKLLRDKAALLEEQVNEVVANNIQKELQLFEQSKMASMGAMIGNIAHQWKQPLNSIAVIASGTRMNKELGFLSEEEFIDNMDKIEEKTNYLSQTIETFRNFLKEKKEVIEVVLQDRIDTALNISGTVLKDHGIELINNIDYTNPVKITLVVGELAEVIINIINNAKDILVENNDIKDSWVKLDLQVEDDKVTITIEDNGGGIPEDILPKIFDEYFTTKSDDKGTGLGLYMSHQIVHNSLKGKLYVKNTQNGAKFFIELPR